MMIMVVKGKVTPVINTPRRRTGMEFGGKIHSFWPSAPD